MALALDSNVKAVVTAAVHAKALREAYDIHTIGDLLRHYPRRYVEVGELTPIDELRIDEDAILVAEVVSVKGRDMRQRRGHIIDLVVTDGNALLSLAFFNQKWRMKSFHEGQRCLFWGKVNVYNGKLQLAHPEVLLLTDEPIEDADIESYAGPLIPVYPATAKVNSGKIMGYVRQALDQLGPPDDPLPLDVRERRRLPALRGAFEGIHRPSSREDQRAAERRFKFEEAFVLQTELAKRRSEARALPATPRPETSGGLLAAFDAQLPFQLTAGQAEVSAAIAEDLARPHPMQRLLQGEVGSGKTVVAIRAMLTVVDAGGQAALLAPTEVLAQQHHRTISALLGPLAERGMLGGSDQGTRVALLTGSLGTAARRNTLLEIASGEAGIVIGTHALLEDKVMFADLGLVVVDEQHRFGVEQRAALTTKNGSTPPHVLVMTATPIPRTVAMTVFGDLEISTLTELPKGRAPIQTNVVPLADQPSWIDRVWARVREEVDKGRQVYVVCPRIGDDADEGGGASASELRPAQALVELADDLENDQLQGLRLGVLHGRLPSDAKDEVMRSFAAGQIDVLVATTVIEVGVDVPNASVMVVMDADWFGVSQLHQLRGRIGRGELPGLCLLVTKAETGTPARERLAAVASTTDGFQLSQLDLEQRREGDVLGSDQSGRRSSLRMLKVIRDRQVIEEARTEAAEVVDGDPKLAEHPELASAVRALYDTDRADFLEKT
ncbi:ATP-dependent DNA helicase RecG [Flindersiella endophytica]